MMSGCASIGGRIGASALAVLAACLCGCDRLIDGAVTWPGARLERSILVAGDFPAGVRYERLFDTSDEPAAHGGVPATSSRPEGCSDGLTRVIAATAQRGPGSALRYVATYDGARMVMTVTSWPLDLKGLAAAAGSCAEYTAFFGPSDEGVPITTTPIPTVRPGALLYRQTMRLPAGDDSVYSFFENVGALAILGVAFPTPDPAIAVKATLPQTFLDTAAKQAGRLAKG